LNIEEGGLMELKPAHDVVFDLLSGAVKNLTTATEKGKKDNFVVGMFVGRVLAAIFILRRMTIPQKHIAEMAEKLRGIKIPNAPMIGHVDMDEVVNNIVADHAAHAALKSTSGQGANQPLIDMVPTEPGASSFVACPHKKRETALGGKNV